MGYASWYSEKNDNLMREKLIDSDTNIVFGLVLSILKYKYL